MFDFVADGRNEPPRLGSMTRSAMMDTEGALTFDALPGGTRMRWSWDLRPRGLFRLIMPLVGLLGRRQERAIWGESQRLLESEPRA